MPLGRHWHATTTDTQINTGLFSLTVVLSNAIRIAQFRPSLLMNLEIQLMSSCVSFSLSIPVCFSLGVFPCPSSCFLSDFPLVSFCLLFITCCHICTNFCTEGSDSGDVTLGDWKLNSSHFLCKEIKTIRKLQLVHIFPFLKKEDVWPFVTFNSRSHLAVTFVLHSENGN